MSATRELTLNPSTPTVVFAVVALSATLIVSFLGWRKSGFRRGTGLLEILRVLLVCLALWTLLQPEYREVYRPTEKTGTGRTVGCICQHGNARCAARGRAGGRYRGAT